MSPRLNPCKVTRSAVDTKTHLSNRILEFHILRLPLASLHMSDFQLAILGGGPAGYVAAIRASQLGLKTVIIEKNPTLGGTCLNVGCIPSKALLASSEHFHFATHQFKDHGILADNLRSDIPAMMKRKDSVVSRLTKGIDYLIKKNKIERKLGFGKLLDAHTIEVSDADSRITLTADTIILATGSVPVELPFLKFDGDRIVSSDQAIAFDKVPESLLVIGAGAIGLELGSVWNRLGSKVTVLEFLPRVAAGMDTDISSTLQKSFERQGLTFHLNTQVQAAKITKGGVTLTAVKDAVEQTYTAEKVLVAVGRRPFHEGIGLEAAGVELTEKGRVKTDSHWKTSQANIYAIGDLIDGPMLAHKAEEEGIAVAEIIAGKAGHVNFDCIPNVIYTSPEAASVGLTEDALKKAGTAYKSSKFNIATNGRALANDTAEGFVKILADAKTDRVLGVHIIASNASELIAEAVLLMEFQGSAEDLARTVHAHPTMAESLKEAALGIDGRMIHG